MSGKLRTEYSDAVSSPGLSLWQVTNSWQRTVRAALAPFGLTHVQFVLLASLTWMHGATPVSQKDLARHAGTDPMMTSQILRVLETKELITRSPHPTDRRAWMLEPTDEGVRLASEANTAVEAADRAYFAALGPRAADFLAHLQTLHRAHGSRAG